MSQGIDAAADVLSSKVDELLQTSYIEPGVSASLKNAISVGSSGLQDAFRSFSATVDAVLSSAHEGASTAVVDFVDTGEPTRLTAFIR